MSNQEEHPMSSRKRRRRYGQVISTEFDYLEHDGKTPTRQISFVLDQLRGGLPWSAPLYMRVQFCLTDVKGVIPERGWIGVVRHGCENDDEDSDSLGVNGDIANDVSELTGRGNGRLNGEVQNLTDGPWEEIEDMILEHRAQRKHESNSEKRREQVSWLVAHLDVGAMGTIQFVLYGSWEPIQSQWTPPDTSTWDPHDLKHPETNSRLYRDRLTLFQQMFAHVKHNLMPLLSEEPSEDWLELERAGKLLAKPYRRSNFLLGTVAEPLWEYLYAVNDKMGVVPYLKYLFPPILSGREADQENSGDTSTKAAGLLPSVFRFGTLNDLQLQTVLDRSVTPRTLTLLRKLFNVGLWDENKSFPIGWGFIGKDGSLSSMHVEPEYRGKALAVLLGNELLRKQAERFLPAITARENEAREKVCGWADVAPDNVASQRVMVKMNGKVGWRVGYCRINLAEAHGI